MQVQNSRRSLRRRAATIVEVAIVLQMFLLFLFGIFEYCRYLMLLQISTNAARDAARFAVVSSSNSQSQTFTVHLGPTIAAIDTVDAPNDTNRPKFQVPFIENYLKTKMARTDELISGFQVRVFPVDPNLLYSDPVVIRAKSQPTAPKSWNKAAFSERIAVQIVGFYNPILPNFLMINGPVPINTICLMGSEG